MLLKEVVINVSFHKNEEFIKEDIVKVSFRWSLVRSQLKWAGHWELMEEERLTKRADALTVKGRRRRIGREGSYV